jgi:hypothetical protein
MSHLTENLTDLCYRDTLVSAKYSQSRRRNKLAVDSAAWGDDPTMTQPDFDTRGTQEGETLRTDLCGVYEPCGLDPCYTVAYIYLPPFPKFSFPFVSCRIELVSVQQRLGEHTSSRRRRWCGIVSYSPQAYQCTKESKDIMTKACLSTIDEAPVLQRYEE